jgi:acyl-CoA thioesterase I
LAIGAAIMIITFAGILLAQNAQNPKDPEAQVRVACVGDSITEGSDYPSELWMLLGSNYTVGNFGHGGTTVSIDAPTPYMRQIAFQEAKGFKPDTVIIMLGTNDAAPNVQSYNAFFADDYLKLVGEFQALPSNPQIWLVLPPPIWNNGTGLSTQFFQQNIIPKIQEVANQTNLPTINLYAALSNRPDCFPDGVHPNVEGSQLIAQELYKTIVQRNP